MQHNPKEDTRLSSAFDDAVVVITGAASGIGWATAQAFYERGARVCLVDIDPRVFSAAAELGPRAQSYQVDVTDGAAVYALADEIVDRFGRVDVLHNNAGVCISKPIAQTTLADWKWVLDINLWGVIHGISAFVPILLRQGHGHIVNTASLAGLMPFPLVVAYCASKYAVVGLSEALATELAPAGIGVTVECPGMVATQLFENARVGWPAGARRRFEWLMKNNGTNPHKVAHRIVRSVQRKQTVDVAAGPALPLFLLRRFSWRLYGRLAGWVAGMKKTEIPKRGTRKTKVSSHSKVAKTQR
jgi:NAD(P)-dependent dehydrogenase (short-subunit alcohol dehydrogenase family)